MLERNFQSQLIKDLKKRFPNCMVVKNDSGYLQGIPDLMVLHGKHWAALEVKRAEDSHKQPNQEYYVSKMNEMSYSKFVYPENKQQVLDELERMFNDDLE